MDSQSPSAEQVSQFVRAANKASASVERVKRSPTALDQALRSATQGAGRLILAEPDDLAPESPAPFKRTTRRQVAVS
jgi:hypothetical protein